jgi:hypothetical protein
VLVANTRELAGEREALAVVWRRYSELERSRRSRSFQSSTATQSLIHFRFDASVAGTDRSLRSTVPQIAAGYSIEGLLEFRDKSNSLLAGERNAAQILSAAGTVVSSSGDRVSRLPMLDQKGLQLALRGRLALRSRSFGGGAQFRVAAAPVVRRGERQVIVAPCRSRLWIIRCTAFSFFCSLPCRPRWWRRRPGAGGWPSEPAEMPCGPRAGGGHTVQPGFQQPPRSSVGGRAPTKVSPDPDPPQPARPSAVTISRLTASAAHPPMIAGGAIGQGDGAPNPAGGGHAKSSGRLAPAVLQVAAATVTAVGRLR